MKETKPTTLGDYELWLQRTSRLNLRGGYDVYYGAVARTVKFSWEEGSFWQELQRRLPSWNDRYRVDHGGHSLLERSTSPSSLLTKPYPSFVEKTFRRNIVENRNWPSPPRKGWFVHPSWFQNVNDITRTTLVANYLDGVEALTQHCLDLASELGIQNRVYWEARDTGYYASHLYFTQAITLPEWGSPETVICNVQLEVQITTRLKETIRALTHPYYEARRATSRSDRPWQWNYRSDEFIANYLGHTLHFLEGVMLELRERPSTATSDGATKRRPDA